MSHLTYDPIDLNAFLQLQDHAAGASLLFTGTVRNVNEGRPVDGMSYSAHEALAEKALQQICAQACEQHPIQSCHIVHRLGDLKLGEVSVAILVLSAHRDAAYQASRWAIEELKRSVPIWKKEHYIDGHSCYLDGQSLEQAL